MMLGIIVPCAGEGRTSGTRQNKGGVEDTTRKPDERGGGGSEDISHRKVCNPPLIKITGFFRLLFKKPIKCNYCFQNNRFDAMISLIKTN